MSVEPVHCIVTGIVGPTDHGLASDISYQCALVTPEGTIPLAEPIVPVSHRYAEPLHIIPYKVGTAFPAYRVDGYIQAFVPELPYVQPCPSGASNIQTGGDALAAALLAMPDAVLMVLKRRLEALR